MPNNNKKNVKAIPEGFRALTIYLTVSPAKEAIEFYKKAFGAKENYRMEGPDGKVVHADLQIDDSRLLLSDEIPGMTNSRAPKSVGATTAAVWYYVKDVDAVFARALKAGATSLMPLADQFWGDRFGSLKDPFGHEWQLAQHIEDVTPEEATRRGREFFSQAAGKK